MCSHAETEHILFNAINGYYSNGVVYVSLTERIRLEHTHP